MLAKVAGGKRFADYLLNAIGALATATGDTQTLPQLA
jgi:hypothetical protein